MLAPSDWPLFEWRLWELAVWVIDMEVCRSVMPIRIRNAEFAF